MILETTAVEDHGVDTNTLGALCNELADFLACFAVARRTEIPGGRLLESRDGGDGDPTLVIDDLGVEVAQTAKDGETRPLRGSPNMLPETAFAFVATLLAICDAAHAVAPCFPALVRIRSSA